MAMISSPNPHLVWRVERKHEEKLNQLAQLTQSKPVDEECNWSVAYPLGKVQNTISHTKQHRDLCKTNAAESMEQIKSPSCPFNDKSTNELPPFTRETTKKSIADPIFWGKQSNLNTSLCVTPDPTPLIEEAEGQSTPLDISLSPLMRNARIDEDLPTNESRVIRTQVPPCSILRLSPRCLHWMTTKTKPR
jgi:hypothetical protein